LPAHDPVTRLRPLRAVTRRALLWAVAAVLGIVITAALTWSVSRLTRERIGLSAESPSVVGGLAPAHALPPGRKTRIPTRDAPARRPSAGPGLPQTSAGATVPTAPSPPPAPVPRVSPKPASGDTRDDSGGGSHGSRGAPDD